MNKSLSENNHSKLPFSSLYTVYNNEIIISFPKNRGLSKHCTSIMQLVLQIADKAPFGRDPRISISPENRRNSFTSLSLLNAAPTITAIYLRAGLRLNEATTITAVYLRGRFHLWANSSGHTYAPTYIDTHLLITYIYTNTLTPKQTQKEFIHTVTYAHIFDKG